MTLADLAKLFENLNLPAMVIGTLVLLLPGFVAFKIDQLVRPQAVRSAFDASLEIIIYSVVNDVLCAPFYTILGLTALPTSLGGWAALFTVLFITPAVLTIAYTSVVHLLAVRGWVQSPLAKPWDHVFSRVARKHREGLGVVITMRDKRVLGGRYINPGFASSFPADEQLLLGEVWHLDKRGAFSQPVAGSCGMLIDKADILILEFFSWPPPNYGSPVHPIESKSNMSDMKKIVGTDNTTNKGWVAPTPPPNASATPPAAPAGSAVPPAATSQE